MLSSVIITLFEFLLFMAVEWMYIRLMREWQLGSSNIRKESGMQRPIVGGGIVFYAAMVCASMCLDWQAHPAMSAIWIGALGLLAGVSMIDDFRPLSVSVRLGVQFIATIMLIAATAQWTDGMWLRMPLCLFTGIFIVGFMNAYNFMDGTDGITPLYSIVVLGTLIFFGLDAEWALPVIAAAAAFTCFNFRRHSAVFSGDVGSIIMGAFIAVMICSIMPMPQGLTIVSLYIVDTGLTVFTRLLGRKNIFKAHREHVYQLLVYRAGISGRCVGVAYALLQLIINIPYCFIKHDMAACTWYSVAVYAALAGIWCWLHLSWRKRPEISQLYL